MVQTHTTVIVLAKSKFLFNVKVLAETCKYVVVDKGRCAGHPKVPAVLWLLAEVELGKS